MNVGDIQLKSIPSELSGKKSLLSPPYMLMAVPHCLRLLLHWARMAEALALPSAGKSIAAKMAIMAMTTRSSMRVNACGLDFGWALLVINKLITEFTGPARCNACRGAT